MCRDPDVAKKSRTILCDGAACNRDPSVREVDYRIPGETDLNPETESDRYKDYLLR